MTDAEFPPKKIATQVKHSILRSYLGAWGGIIVQSNRRWHQRDPLRLCYVDTCCGSGVYQAGEDSGDERDEIGSPIIALRELRKLARFASDRCVQLQLKAMFINHHLGELEHLRTVVGKEDVGGTETTFVHAEFGHVRKEVLGFTDDWFAFVLVDPYGPKAIPLDAVAPLVQQPRNDCLIYFATNGISRWAGIARKDREDLSPEEQKILQLGSAFFGTSDWINASRGTESSSEREDRLALLYRQQLEGSVVRSLAIPLLYDDQAKTKYHLVFTSRNTAGLYSMKEQFRKGDQYQYLLRSRAAIKAEEKRSGPLLPGFDPARGEARRPDPEHLKAHILTHLEGNPEGTFEQILEWCIDVDDVLPPDVKKAITALRKEGRVQAPASSALKYRSIVKLSKS